jgi:DNA polymerase III sliding clamp (beta) subunit (PCNA family)
MLALFKHAKNFAAKDDSRPLYRCIHFDGKRAIVTNTHMMVIVNNLPFESKNVHVKTGKEIKGVFPDVDKVIPKETRYNTVFMNIDQVIRALKTATEINKGNAYNSVSLCGTTLKLETNWTKCVFEFDGVFDQANPEIWFNAKYLHDILVFMKDAGATKFNVGFNESTQPFVIYPDKDMLAIVTPIRNQGGKTA